MSASRQTPTKLSRIVSIQHYSPRFQCKRCTWLGQRDRDVFSAKCRVGARHDALFLHGADWHFHAKKIRALHFFYFSTRAFTSLATTGTDFSLFGENTSWWRTEDFQLLAAALEFGGHLRCGYLQIELCRSYTRSFHAWLRAFLTNNADRGCWIYTKNYSTIEASVKVEFWGATATALIHHTKVTMDGMQLHVGLM